jgi:hypothetical protein
LIELGGGVAIPVSGQVFERLDSCLTLAHIAVLSEQRASDSAQHIRIVKFARAQPALVGVERRHRSATRRLGFDREGEHGAAPWELCQQAGAGGRGRGGVATTELCPALGKARRFRGGRGGRLCRRLSKNRYGEEKSKNGRGHRVFQSVSAPVELRRL